MTMVIAKGGDGYWNLHPDDDPIAIVDELIPSRHRKQLGVAPNQMDMMGTSMGGYGALVIAERHSGLVSAFAAISPSVWTSYAQANTANASANVSLFASASAFAAGDVIKRAASLQGVPVRVASEVDGPFHSGVERLVSVLPSASTVLFSAGCHTDPFFLEQESPSLAVLSRHLIWFHHYAESLDRRAGSRRATNLRVLRPLETNL